MSESLHTTKSSCTAAAAVPPIDDWSDWVSASAIRNHVLGHPLLDWLDRYGEANGFERDTVDDRTDFVRFVMRKGQDFERAVVEHLTVLGVGEMRRIMAEDASSEDRRSNDAVEATLAAMSERVPIVAQGALRDAGSRTFGFPDLLVRSDVLARLFPGALSAASAPAPSLGLDDCHYVVVDIKFTTLRLAAGGGLDNSESNLAYKAQLFVYNRALAALQGHLPATAFLLGRGWRQTKNRVTSRVGNCMDRLAPVGQSDVIQGESLQHRVDTAAAWVRRLRCDGHEWSPLPTPTVPELRPNAKGDAAPWAGAVKQIVAEGHDLTRLWQVGVGKRDAANAAGLTRWTDPAVTPAAVGVKGQTYAPLLQALLDVNRGSGPDVQPARITATREQWAEPADVEFYVDYETVSDLDDDFGAIPERGGQPMIFMIGCGHLEDGEWRFECFVADDLSEASEATVIDDWFGHMAAVQARFGSHSTPRVFHWSAHEQSSLETAYNSAVNRQPARAGHWPRPEWFDFLSRVVKEVPVVVRGAHGFGLKAVANALHALGRVDVSWDTGPTDGLGAMVGAWSCQHQIDTGTAERLDDLDLMQEIRAYNEIDCKAMMAIICYLRENH